MRCGEMNGTQYHANVGPGDVGSAVGAGVGAERLAQPKS